MYATKRTKSKWVVRWWKVLCSVVFGADWIMSKGSEILLKSFTIMKFHYVAIRRRLNQQGERKLIEYVFLIQLQWSTRDDCVCSLLKFQKGIVLIIISNGIKTTTTKTMMMETRIGSEEKLKCMQLSFITL